MQTFDFEGSSGAAYPYFLTHVDPVTLTRQAGTFIFASGTALSPTPVMIAFSNNIRDAALKDWATATDIHKVSLLYIHIGGTESEKRDLVDRYAPSMNR